MSVVIPHKTIEAISQSRDPKKTILDALGNLSGIRVIRSDWCLVAIYVRPEKTAGGIIRPTVNVQEDIWQGKAGLLLKLGPNAFRDEQGELYEVRADVGDWVQFDVNEARPVQFGGVACRWVKDINIFAVLDDPNIVY